MELHNKHRLDKLIFSSSTSVEEGLREKNKNDIKVPSQKNVKKGTTKKKKRCAHSACRKKLKLTDIECKCSKRFCAKHRLPESHPCSWNPKGEKEMEEYRKSAGLDETIRFSKLEYI